MNSRGEKEKGGGGEFDDLTFFRMRTRAFVGVLRLSSRAMRRCGKKKGRGGPKTSRVLGHQKGTVVSFYERREEGGKIYRLFHAQSWIYGNHVVPTNSSFSTGGYLLRRTQRRKVYYTLHRINPITIEKGEKGKSERKNLFLLLNTGGGEKRTRSSHHFSEGRGREIHLIRIGRGRQKACRRSHS